MMAIEKFMKEYAAVYVSNKNEKDIANIAEAIMETGIKEKDAYHVACAIKAECNYFVTTDDRLLKFQSEKIRISGLFALDELDTNLSPILL